MVRSYFRYTEEAAWAVAVSGGARIAASADGRSILTPMLESVGVWPLRGGGTERRMRPRPTVAATASETTALQLSPDGEAVAVGYSDGTVRLWPVAGREPLLEEERVALSGHRSAVLCLAFAPDGSQLASGGADTLVVLWDVVAEAGVCKLRGHRGPVTGVAMIASLGALASVSKDGTLRLWDLHTQHCVQTCASPAGELWSVDMDESAGRLLTGGAGGELLLWTIAKAEVAGSAGGESGAADGATEEATPVGVDPLWMAAHATLRGSIATTSSAKVAQISCSADGGIVGVLYGDRTMGLWRARDGGERLKRAGKRRPLCGLRGSHKLHSFAFLPPRKPAAAPSAAKASRKRGSAPPPAVRVLVAQRDNSAAVWEVDTGARTAVPVPGACAPPAGHKHEPRAVALSGDGGLLASASDGEARVWSLGSRQCVRSLACGYGLSVAFVAGNKLVAVGTKSGGSLPLYELATGELVHENASAHSGAVWSLAVEPGGAALLSASADKTVATWSVVGEGGGGGASLAPELSADLGDDAMVVEGVTARRVHLTLYGHKLPVLCVGVSSDGTICASGSADKSVKLWGLDFGDMHRSLRAHTEPVTALAWDRLIKLWDADTYQLIHALRGHHAEVWSLAVSRDGGLLASASRDRSLRLPLAEGGESRGVAAGGARPLREGSRDHNLAYSHGRLLERRRAALDRNRRSRYLTARRSERRSAYLLRALGSVRPAELEQALLLLPFDAARTILYLLRVHHKPLVASRALLDLLGPIHAALSARVSAERARLGYNTAAREKKTGGKRRPKQKGSAAE
ncbi:hypothetical protein EMIHUDRAFT_209137 [Emiliania huxleyi CCMP1516]|uniref:U3 small nucleolar RNA-associated protein 13 C-terminal domain-containing protein n=5 Tax=Emiliania huxleyi TaxID=2903 RepID=A0A0D3J7R2_EMIH1|nr:hypothetical protein EMIHUDRAFT_209137 [Emiliania huxleyi CCMP1516]EOD19547.1 hypothetical protein EMIHUDRAFT_209137 [Emiliania huxleyi CCMP1516]|eukprot:XP_005771976.1 hypothetical protein EMIHUDRAFT_209137 [Emiliania huxleyi CCMP1516]